MSRQRHTLVATFRAVAAERTCSAVSPAASCKLHRACLTQHPQLTHDSFGIQKPEYRNSSSEIGSVSWAFEETVLAGGFGAVSCLIESDLSTKTVRKEASEADIRGVNKITLAIFLI